MGKTRAPGSGRQYSSPTAQPVQTGATNGPGSPFLEGDPDGTGNVSYSNWDEIYTERVSSGID